MSYNKPRMIAVLVSIGLGVLTFVTALATAQFTQSLWLVSAITAILVFTVSYLLYRFIVEGYFDKRIRLIYKNIYRVKRSKPNEAKANTDILKQVDADVSAWANEFKSELDELKSREKFRREFIGNVSHELKTPIFNIQGYLLTLLDGGLEDETINRLYLKRANKSVDRLIHLIEDMDTLNRLESNVIELKFVRFDLIELTREVIDLLEDKAKKANVSLQINMPSEKVIFVNADVQRIEQVLFNLVINAIKYSRKENGLVEILFHNMGETILVEVIDNGIGIPDKDINRIFERFYRVDKSRARGTGGSGLGLSIVKHIIDQHHQILNVTSKNGRGSTFTFTLKKF